MTRGHQPVVAIGEAKRKAKARGFMLIAVETDGQLPFDFVINDRGCISLVRVRRLRYPRYEIHDIEISCAQEIAQLREIPVTGEIFRELWVRGPDRHWHRYLVLPDAIEFLEDGDDDSGNSGEVPPPSCSRSHPSHLAVRDLRQEKFHEQTDHEKQKLSTGSGDLQCKETV